MSDALGEYTNAARTSSHRHDLKTSREATQGRRGKSVREMDREGFQRVHRGPMRSRRDNSGDNRARLENQPGRAADRILATKGIGGFWDTVKS